MFKKLSLLLGLVSVAAFAVPSVASAVGVTQSAGVLAKPGTAITETSTNVKVTSSKLGTVTCEKVTAGAVLVENNAESVEAEGKGEGTAANCINNGKAIKITDFTYKRLRIGPFKLTSLTFKIDFFGIECHYEEVSLAVKYTAGTSSTNVSGPLNATPAACGTTKIEGDWTMEIGSTPVILD